jgi:hypothetical protein
MKSFVFLLILLFVFQSIDTFSQDFNFKVSGYVDVYYATDNDASIDTTLGTMRQFSYINSQKDQFRLNIAQISTNFQYKDEVRGIITFQAGDLVKNAWQGYTLYPMIQQANIGINVAENVWLDAGYFLTHIGAEYVLPKDNWLTSHSLVTYYEPFYQAGARIGYETKTLTAQLSILNGHGIFEENNYNKTIGLFLSYLPIKDLTLSYASDIGNEIPGYPADGRLFMHHNFVALYNITPEFAVKGQFDLATLAKKDSLNSLSYTAFSLQTKYQITDKLSVAARFASVNNEENIFIQAFNPILDPDPVKGIDITLGCEYKPSPVSYLRLEGRMLSMDDKYKRFKRNNNFESSRMEVMLNFGVILE